MIIVPDEFAIRRIKSGLRAFFIPMPVIKTINGKRYHCISLFGVLWCRRQIEEVRN